MTDEPDEPAPSWNAEGEDLAFLRDEGLELLAEYRKIVGEQERRLVLDLVRALAGER